MNKLSRRGISVLLIAVLIICGLVLYAIRYMDSGRDWALYFAVANSGSTGEIRDRNGELLASFDATERLYSSDSVTRKACYHVTGDYWGRTGTGLLSRYWNEMQSFSPITGTTVSESDSLTLNIDAALNRVAYIALGERKGAVMLCNYSTGEVLCMVSTPTVDPLDAESEPGDGAFINRCLSAAYPPGSVFKLITAASAIENIPDIYERSFYCEGEYEIAGVPIVCTGEHYTQTFEQALSNSCNCAFAQIAVRLGQDAMVESVTKYGLLDVQSLDGILGAAGSYPTEFVGDPELAWSCIGQSTDLVTPYAMLRFVAAVANHGILVEPHLVASDSEPERTLLVEPDTANKLAAMMSYNAVSHYNSAENFPGLDICAKTGTAEVGDGNSHAWFAGFLNDEAHPYAFIVLVENGGYGLSTAGTLANELLQYAVFER